MGVIIIMHLYRRNNEFKEIKKTCTYFGHRNAPDTIKPVLRETIIDLIENKGVNLFYVGNQGAFDRMTIKVLRELKEKYPDSNTSQRKGEKRL